MVVLDMSSFEADSEGRPRTAIFGVFDGHGGKEVARFSAAHLPDTLAQTEAYNTGDLVTALSEAFLEIDNLLMLDEHREELKALKGADEEEEGHGEGGGMTITSSQLPEALLEALGVPGDGGLVFKIVKSSNGQMRLQGSDEEPDEGEEVGEERKSAIGENDSATTVIEIVHADQDDQAGRDPAEEEEDAGPAGASAVADVSPNAGGNGKRKRAEGLMDVDEGSQEAAPPGEMIIEELSTSRTEEEWSGPSAGCTAVCAVIRDGELCVANAGDSRCILCRGGEAVALTRDHKPMDPEEYARITKAGGFVADGRVNGSLNLSRALGDLEYKQNTELPAEAQMVTASPEVRKERLQEDDEFLILACDGIWDVLTNQEAVDFVRERLLMGKSPREIAEEACDRCLAPDTSGCGKGCDNMSIIVVVLQNSELARKVKAARDAAGISTAT